MRMLQIVCLSLIAALPLIAQNTNPSPNNDSDHLQVAERPADTYDSRDAMVVPEGTEIVVRTNEAIDSTTANEGQSFSGTVQNAVLSADGETLIPKGSDVSLVVRRLSTGGTTGSPEVALGLDSINIQGQRYFVNSETVERGNDQGIGKTVAPESTSAVERCWERYWARLQVAEKVLPSVRWPALLLAGPPRCLPKARK